MTFQLGDVVTTDPCRVCGADVPLISRGDGTCRIDDCAACQGNVAVAQVRATDRHAAATRELAAATDRNTAAILEVLAFQRSLVERDVH